MINQLLIRNKEIRLIGLFIQRNRLNQIGIKMGIKLSKIVGRYIIVNIIKIKEGKIRRRGGIK